MDDRIIGRRAVLEALYAARRRVRKIVVARGLKGSTFREIVEEAERYGIEVQEMERKRLDSVAGTREHQGIIAVASALQDENLSSVLARAHQLNEDPLLVLVDGVTDPQNMGAILRTAETAGAHGAILPERNSAPLDRTTTKASSGAVEHLPIARVGNIGQAVLRLRDEGLRVYAADADPGARSLYEVPVDGGVAVLLGSEGRGLSQLLKDRCDACIRIPMRGRIKSLNVSAAAAVILFEIQRRRGRT